MATALKKLPGLTQYIKESREELAKVTWPTRQATIRYTTIVMVASVLVGLLTGALDYILALVLERFIL